MKLTYIYAHVSPIENEIFYIGKADDPWDRLIKHLSAAKTKPKNYHQANKLRRLAAQGLRPRLEIIAEVPAEEWKFWEKHYIKYFRALGFRLTNATVGGDAPMEGRRHSPEALAKISAASAGENNPNFGKKHSPKTIAKMVAAKAGKPGHSQSLETRAKIGAAQVGEKNHNFGKLGAESPNFGKPCSAETRQKISAAKTGVAGAPHTPETCEKMRQSKIGSNNPMFGKTGASSPNFGRVFPPATIEKMRAAAIKREQNKRKDSQ